MKFGDPIIYHLEDGDTAPGFYVRSLGNTGDDLRVLFSDELVAKYGDRDGWFSKEFLTAYHNCVPECCARGTSAGEWEPLP